MPDINLPHKFITGEIIDADKFSQNISLAGAQPNSFEVINGWLDSDNLPPMAEEDSWSVESYHLKNDTFAAGGMVGSTQNLDFFWDAFPAVGQFERSAGNIPAGHFKPIAGACASFYVPYRAIVLFTWQVSFTGAAETGNTIDQGLRVTVGGADTNQLPASAINISNDQNAASGSTNGKKHRGFVQAGSDNNMPEIRLIINDRRVNVAGDSSIPATGNAIGGAPSWTRRYGHRGGVEGANMRSERHYSGHFIWGVQDYRAAAGASAPMHDAGNAVEPGWYSAGLYMGLEGYLEGIQQFSHAGDEDHDDRAIAYWRRRGAWCARTRVRNFKYLIIRV